MSARLFRESACDSFILLCGFSSDPSIDPSIAGHGECAPPAKARATVCSAEWFRAATFLSILPQPIMMSARLPRERERRRLESLRRHRAREHVPSRRARRVPATREQGYISAAEATTAQSDQTQTGNGRGRGRSAGTVTRFVRTAPHRLAGATGAYERNRRWFPFSPRGRVAARLPNVAGEEAARSIRTRHMPTTHAPRTTTYNATRAARRVIAAARART